MLKIIVAVQYDPHEICTVSITEPDPQGLNGAYGGCGCAQGDY
jgi:hypothetical protein